MQLQYAFGDLWVKSHHIGSTAIPGISAKPTIDMIVEVTNVSAVDGLNAALQNLGFEAKGENGIPGRRFFQKGGDKRTHHLHVFTESDPQIHRHLVFCDYLRAHPGKANEYEALKLSLAQTFLDITPKLSGRQKRVDYTGRKAGIGLAQ